MTTLQLLMIVDGALGSVLLVYDDVAWSVVTGTVWVVVWIVGLFAAIGGVAGALGYLAGLALG